MTLTNLLQLTNDLNPNFQIYLRTNNEDLPLTKLKIKTNECYLITGKKALTIKHLQKLAKNLHHRGIPLKILLDEEIPVYGVQISIENSTITLI